MKKILTISNNPRLLAVRNDMLAISGYSVASPRYLGDAPMMLAAEDFVAVIIGHSVLPAERRRLIPLMRAIRPVPIVFVAPTGEPPEPLADYSVDIGQNPGALLAVLQRCEQAG